MKNKGNIIFSLDIGTRKVVGIVAEQLQDKLRIIDLEVIEHKSRTMLDGQIHNVNEVTKIVKTVKENLEKRLGIKLEKVGVAVAGRALKTVQAKIEKEISLNEEIVEDAVRNLELEALSSVLNDASHNFGRGDYYCVGYSVVYYELDGATIGNLLGHFGQHMAVEVIATFLPRMVLDSMRSVLNKVELEVINLTLEPIAAINVIVPPDMRRLNISLLDIGAGTTDIALTKEGMVFAYGMVPEAGDEITEFICEKYILDFNAAEKVKKSIMIQPKVKFKDILGRTYEIDSDKVINEISHRVRELANSIAKCVLELNQKVPHAVVLVGGGSLTPLLDRELACSFPLDNSNIGIRLPAMISGIENKIGRLEGPDMVTPLGICLMTAQSSGLKFMEFSVNEKRVHVLDMQQNLDVLSVLVAGGIDQLKLYGKIGRAICVEVNGQLKIIKGKMGKPAQIKLNDKKAELSCKVKNRDSITFAEAEDGEDAQGKVKDVIDAANLTLMFNGQPLEVKPQIFVNGFPVALDADLVDRVTVAYKQSVDVRHVLKEAGIDMEALTEREVVIRVNKEPRVLSQSNFRLLVDGNRASLNTEVSAESVIEFKNDQPEFYRIRDVVEIPSPGLSVSVLLNGQKHMISGAPGKIFMNGQLVESEEFLIDRAEIITCPGENVPPTVSHVLKYLPLNPEELKGKTLKIVVNGKPGGFTTQLSDGTQVTVCFEER